MEIEKHRKVPNILITGTPGTGKTTICKLLNDALGFTYLPISSMILQHKLYDTWNEQFNVPEFDDDKLIDYIDANFDIQKGGLLFEFHSSDFFPVRYFDLVVLLRCDNTHLHDRLKERGYAPNKILENIDCELLEVTHDEVFEAYDESIILQLQNSEPGDVEKNLTTIINWLTDWKNKNASE